MGCDQSMPPTTLTHGISIHASRMGCDAPASPTKASRRTFQSTHPVWDATQSTPQANSKPKISIHASRMGCDMIACFLVMCVIFQSTHPVWDATGIRRLNALAGGFQSTHPVWDATLHTVILCGLLHGFQSTHPVWDATNVELRAAVSAPISIHASRMGCDSVSCSASTPPKNFNPRIPYGMRHDVLDMQIMVDHFNPRIPYGMRLREWTLHSIIWKLLPALRADYIADIPEHLSVCIFGL